MKFEKHDLVYGTWENSAVGFVKRVSKDGDWADVAWYGGLGYQATMRAYTRDLRKLDLNKMNGYE